MRLHLGEGFWRLEALCECVNSTSHPEEHSTGEQSGLALIPCRMHYDQTTLLHKVWFPEYEQQKAEQTEFNTIIKCNYNHTTGAHDHAQLIFVFLVEMGFNHVGQAGLELLTSGDPSTSVSQSAGITGVSHCAWPGCVYYKHWFAQAHLRSAAATALQKHVLPRQTGSFSG
ncbi:hypothetical protein AAY473_038049 [Plecturocebus cupreus]